MSLSVIVIGENEAETLPEILERFRQLSQMLDGFNELIFVDSDSKDNSVLIVEGFKKANPDLDISLCKIVGNINAAIARNVGIRHLNSNCEFVFFLDGDVVFELEFVAKAIELLKKEKDLGTVTGNIFDHYSGTSYNQTSIRKTVSDDAIRHHGGNFLTVKKVISEIGLFDKSLTKHQDIDYTFRIRKAGYRLSKLEDVLGHHYTVHYLNLTRICSDLIKGKYLSTGTLFRKYILSEFRKDMLLSGSVRSGIAKLVLSSGLIFSFFVNELFLIWVGFMAVFLSRTNRNRGETFMARFVSIFSGIQFALGAILPSRKKRYKEI